MPVAVAPRAERCPVVPLHRSRPHRVTVGPSPAPTRRRRPAAVVPIAAAARRAADTPADVAALIGELGPAWHVSSAVPIGLSAVADLLVVGPAGVFTVAVAAHPDADVRVRGESFRVDGSGHTTIRTSRVHAALAAAALTRETGRSVRVRALVAVAGADVRLTITGQPADGAVTVLDAREIAAHLAALPAEPSGAEVPDATLEADDCA